MRFKKGEELLMAFTSTDTRWRVYSSSLSLELVWKELEVFSKLVVRGRNQHRRDKCYQMLVRVCKDLKHYQKAGFIDNLKKFARRPSNHKDEVNRVEKKVAVCLRFTRKLLQFLEKTFMCAEDYFHDNG